jgi:hypothetical protein
LSRDEFRVLTQRNCAYCGQEPQQIFKTGTTYVYNGIDRLNSSLGYFSENVVPCCGTCNVMKMAMGEKEFLDHINKIHYHQHQNKIEDFCI